MFRHEKYNHLLIRLLGWVATLLHGDASIFDRWLWLRRRLLRGDLRTLDAGCGSGVFSLYAARLGNEVVGISGDERNNRAAEQRAGILGLERANFVTRDLRELDRFACELGVFDQIICCETIEHILDDQTLVRNLGRLLRPGGRLFITTPSDRHRPFAGELLSEEEDGGHVRFGYSHDDLRRLFEGAGLETLSLGHLMGPISQVLVRIQWAISPFSRLLGWALTVPFRPLQVLDPAIARVSNVPSFCVTGVAIRRG